MATRNCPDGVGWHLMASGWVPVPALLLKAGTGRRHAIFRATPGRVRRAETQDGPGWKRKEKALGPSLVPPVVGIRGCEQNHLWDICEGRRALEMPTERQKKSFTHAFIPQSLSRPIG